MKRQKITIGSIVEIPVKGEYYCYAQIVKNSNYAFFDFKSETKLEDITILNDKPILFIVGVYNYVVTKGIWLKVGKLDLREELEVLPMKYIQDSIDKSFSFYDPNTGEITPATREQCLGLECCAAWEEGHIEDRLFDHYNGVECQWIPEIE